MITEEEKEYNYLGFELLSIANSYEETEDTSTESLPARSEVRTESLPARTGRGFSNDEIEAIERSLDDVYEGIAPQPTTENPRLVTRGPLSAKDTLEKFRSSNQPHTIG